jgi:hypothetical protein
MTRQYFYDGRSLFASLEGRPDGWHVKDADGTELGIFPARDFAVSFINARIAGAPAAPVTGERGRDLDRVHAIRRNQQQAQASRTRRSGTKR